MSGARQRRPWLGARRWTLLLILAAGLVGALTLGLDSSGLIPRDAGRILLGDMARAAVAPALTYENMPPAGTAPLIAKIAGAVWSTLLYAVAAMSLALPAGLTLGLLSSDVFWSRRLTARGETLVSPAARTTQWLVRIFTALLRSVHELLWAIIFLAALGLAPASAIIAIALPFAGTIAKVSAGILDETPRNAWSALDGAGASRWTGLAVGLIPAAAPELISYAFYRFECALRSAAVLGFFGAPTIGTYIFQSFENLQLREMWSYLYALIAMVLFSEWLGARLRRSLR